MDVEVRPAGPADEAALSALDWATWTWLSSPAPRPSEAKAFFDERTQPQDVLVAILEGEVAGYVRLTRATELASSDHVRHINALAVSEVFRRLGVGRALLYAAMAAAEAHGARRLTLRVLGPNEAARRLYESVGFVEEGVLRGEFVLEGRAVDDVLMARGLRGEPR